MKVSGGRPSRPHAAGVSPGADAAGQDARQRRAGRPPSSASIAVVGGGPAGSALARRLALLGYDDVVLFERRPPRQRGFAESLSPGVRVHLDTLGIDVPPGRLCTSKLVRWRGETERVEIESFIVDRAVFDAHLLDAAAEAGVRVIRAGVLAERKDAIWRLHAGATTIETPFLADATGHAGLLRRPRRATAPRALALRARWDGIDAPPEMRICTLREGWMWGVEGPDGAYHVASFTDRSRPFLPQSDFFPFLDRPPDESHACDATPFVSCEPVTRDSILAGETACAIDPLSSSGVQTALAGAIAASITVNTILSTPANTDVAIRFYTDHIARASARHERWTRAHFADAPAASAPASPAAIVDAPVVIGDVVTLRRVVRTPAGENVAFLGGIELVPLLDRLQSGMSAEQVDPAVMRWLVENEVLV